MNSDRTMKWLGIGLLVMAMLSPRFIIARPNRIVDGVVYSARHALDGSLVFLLAFCVALILAVFLKNRFASGTLGLVASAGAMMLVWQRVIFLSDHLSDLNFQSNVAVMNPSLSLALGFYLAIIGVFFAMRASLLDLMGKKWLSNLLSLLIFLMTVTILATAGWLEHISIYIEMSRNWDTVVYELGRHLKLSMLSVFVGLFISLALGIWAYRRRNLENAIFKLINFAQVVPTLSLLALFMIPLTYLSNQVQWIKALGISGIGFAPAFIVLVLYSLLPITSNILTSLKSTRTEIMESARGMGMTEKQVLWKVQFPLAVKPIFAGFRLATLQAVGNCILAGLIGGGGLGSLIFLGLAQSAPDMVLGASLMVVAVAAAADLLLRAGEHLISVKYRGSYD